MDDRIPLDDDYVSPMHTTLRRVALQQAIAVYAAALPYADFDPDVSHSDRVLGAATNFYKFLTGEVK